MPQQFMVTGLDPATGRVVEMDFAAETVIEAMQIAKDKGLRYVAVRRADQPEIDSTPPIEQPDGPPVELAPPESSAPGADPEPDEGSTRAKNGADEPEPAPPK